MTIISKLKYPKELFKKTEVEREKRKFDFKKAWDIKQDKNNFYLVLDDKKIKKEYYKCPGSKIRSKGMGMGLGIGKGKGPIGRGKK